MRTNFFFMLVVCIALAGLMFAGSGINEVFSEERSVDRAEDQIEKAANNSAVGKGNFSAGAGKKNDGGGILGFIVGGLRGLGAIIKITTLLPIQIYQLGFPRWFAYPVGIAMQLITSIGIIQFAANRVYR